MREGVTVDLNSKRLSSHLWLITDLLDSDTTIKALHSEHINGPENCGRLDSRSEQLGDIVKPSFPNTAA